MGKIAPSILSANFARLEEEVRAVEEAGADYIHIDVMDGHFVPNITIGPPVVKAVRKITGLPLDVHLMISNPDKYINDFSKAGADIITVHAEAVSHLHRSVQNIRNAGCKTAVSLNPATPENVLEYVIDDLDMVLIMSVNPGFGGQVFIPAVIPKIRKVKEMISERGLETLIEIDGGITPENIKDVSSAGVDIFVAGSAVFNTDDYSDAIKALREGMG